MLSFAYYFFIYYFFIIMLSNEDEVDEVCKKKSDPESTPTAPYMPPTCPLHAPYMPPTCPLHAPYMPPTCPLRAPYVPRTGPISLVGGGTTPYRPRVPDSCPLSLAKQPIQHLVKTSRQPTSSQLMATVSPSTVAKAYYGFIVSRNKYFFVKGR